MYHASSYEITPGMITMADTYQDCLFFSNRIYRKSSGSYYVYEAKFDTVDASALYDDKIIQHIVDRFDVDEETAESLLDHSVRFWDLYNNGDLGHRWEPAEDDWWLQGKRGECAAKMGYDGCEDEDEQGTVYIIPMTGREHELTFFGTV